MAANSNSFIRVRLHFDYPPPAVVDCRMCWLLLDLNTCRVVADLESIIREKFEFSPRSILNLFIEDCYLPHTEHIFVVRDNDSVRCCVGDGLVPRLRPDESQSCNLRIVHNIKVLLKAKDGISSWTSDDEMKKSKEKCTEKKRKKAEKNSPAVTPKPASTKKTPASINQPAKGTKKPPAAQTKTHSVSSSDSSSSSSEDDEAPKKLPAPKPAPKTPLSTPAASKAPQNTKPIQTKHPTSSSSSETDCSTDEAPSEKIPPKNKSLTSTSPKNRIAENSKSQQASSVLQSTNCAQKQGSSKSIPPDDKVVEPCNTDSEEEIELVIRKPVLQPGHGVGSQASWRGSSRGRTRRGGPGARGRGDGRGHAGSFEFSHKEPSYQTDSLANKSVVFQNGAESAPKLDYSSMPLLAAPPQVGQRIAFKLLELAENYTPEISEYKEGKIVSFDPVTKQMELELLHASQAPVEPGKFDLVYQNPDGSERIEYAVSLPFPLIISDLG
uniref:Uncharacterized protein n=1 Tax=Lates calcarifer TaxID=8187 RepID=A0A4W6FV73_LATCA